ncbi:MAG TPA: hypothetical protein VJ963_03070 [Bacteroidales bacterium]|nr:hypothetical protein [Bacteroidales bacterium]
MGVLLKFVKGNNIKLFLVFMGLCIIILLNTYTNPNGCISPDSSYYLRLSRNLVLHEGFYIPDYSAYDGKSFFAIWPVGYPVMIFIMSKLTGLGIVWASKVLNMLLIGCVLMIFSYLFKENAHWAALIFYTDANISIFSYTWSEGAFIVFLICTSLTLYKSIETGGKPKWLVALLLSGTALFLTRYIGLISVIIIGISSLVVMYRRRWFLSFKLLAVSLLQLLIILLYLYHNKLTTGFITGGLRTLQTESDETLFRQLLSAFKEAIILIRWNIPVLLISGLLMITGIIYLFRKRSKELTAHKGIWKYLLLSGIVYLLSIVSIRWFYSIEPLNYRFMAPGMFLVLLAFFSGLMEKPRLKIMRSSLFFLIILAILGAHYIPGKYAVYKYITTGRFNLENPGYLASKNSILQRYKDVEPGSVVIFGSYHLRYLREDVIPTDIYVKYSLDDMADSFRRNGNWKIYVNITNDLNPDLIHESFFRFMEQNKDKQVVRVR